ncbi:MAG: hypothetical protein ACJ70U_09540 [Nitrososphaera sp.]
MENDDKEAHTVTSGLGAGIHSVQTNQKGKPGGIFDSGSFRPSESESRTFYNQVHTTISALYTSLDGSSWSSESNSKITDGWLPC